MKHLYSLTHEDLLNRLSDCHLVLNATHSSLSALIPALRIQRPVLAEVLQENTERIEKVLRSQGVPGWPQRQTISGDVPEEPH